MKLIRKKSLYLVEDTADKIYDVELCRVSPEKYVVNFRHGKRGGSLREGTKTTTPVALQEAEDIFNSVVVAKLNRGFIDAEQRQQVEGDASLSDAGAGGDIADLRKRIETAVLTRFQEAVSQKNKNRISRAAWRIGELSLTEAVPNLIRLIPSKEGFLNYSVAWALGRCGDPRGHDALKKLQEKTRAGAVRRIVLEALLATAAKGQRLEIITGIYKQLPEPVQKALAREDEEQLAASAALVFQGGQEGMALLEDLYRVALDNDHARRFVLSALATIPLQPGFFKAIRHIYKAAEFRFDAEVLGLLGLRFETEKPCFHRSSWSDHVYLPGTWDYVRIKEEASKPESRLAYSNMTRNYFRRRVWRMLRRLGQVGDERYVKLAAGILLFITDEHASAPRKSEQYRWEKGDDGRYYPVPEVIREYGPFGGFVAFNHILHGNSRNYRLSLSGLSWLTISEDGADTPPVSQIELSPRQEVFPELWDKQPEALWRLLTTSRCEPVHRFAVRALVDNQAFLGELNTAQIIVLLAQPYALTIDLGLTLAREKYDPANPDFDLIKALLSADFEPARLLARQWIEARPDMLAQETALMASILSCTHTDVRLWGGELLDRISFSDSQIESLIARLVAFMLALDDQPDVYEDVIADISTLLSGVWQEYCCRIDIEIIRDMLGHPFESLKVLAAGLLLNHRIPPAEFPPGLIQSLIEGATPELRGIGVQLFGGLPQEVLLGQVDLIFTFCTSGDREVRRAANAIVKQLAQKETGFGDELFERLFPLIFRKAASPDFREDLVALLSDSLEGQSRALDHNTIWRLLQARTKGGRQLGAHLLDTVDPEVFSIRQWAQLGDHDLLAVRQWSWQSFGDRLPKVAGNLTDALRLLDCRWDDTRAFALGFFRNNFDATHWTPALLVGICDITREDVQLFGRELITTFFDTEHGVEYLLKLSQHPSTDVQLFATNLLEEYAQSDLGRIELLTPYFITVLSQVNCGRVAKARVFDFLHRIALESEEGATLIAPVIDRISATIAIGDRGRCVQIMHDISHNYPQAQTRLVRVPTQQRPIKTVEVDNAV